MSLQDDRASNSSSPESSNSGDNGGVGTPPPQGDLPRWATRQQPSAPFSDARMAAYIGPRWESTYRAKLAQFIADPAFTPTWNWAAALGSPFWFLYRKLYMSFIAFFIFPNILLGYVMPNVDPSVMLKDPESPEVMQFAMMFSAVALSSAIAAGGTANWFLFRRARAASMVVTMQQVPEDVALTRLAKLGGVNVRPVVIFMLIMFAFSLVSASAGAR